MTNFVKEALNPRNGGWKNYLGGAVLVVVAGALTRYIVPSYTASVIAKLTFASKAATLFSFGAVGIVALLLGTIAAKRLSQVNLSAHKEKAKELLTSKDFFRILGLSYALSAVVVTAMLLFAPASLPTYAASKALNLFMNFFVGGIVAGIVYPVARQLSAWFTQDYADKAYNKGVDDQHAQDVAILEHAEIKQPLLNAFNDHKKRNNDLGVPVALPVITGLVFQGGPTDSDALAPVTGLRLTTVKKIPV